MKTSIKKKLQKDKNLRFAWQIFMVAVAGVIGGFSFCSFFEPAQIIPTGLSGLAQIIHNLLFQVGVDLATSLIYLIINAIIFVFALKFFGIKFIILTLVGLGTYTLSMQFMAIPAITSQASSDPLLFSIVGGALYGFGVGIACRYGGSTGGSDVLAVIINKYFPRVKRGICILFINMVVIVLAVATSGMSTALYAIIVAVIGSWGTDFILDKVKKVRAFYIICDKDEEIANALLRQYHRGVTRIDGQGMFSKKDKAVLLTLIPDVQTEELRAIVKDIEPNAFVFSNVVSETYGDGTFLKEQSVFKNKILKSPNILKSSIKTERVQLVKKKKFLRKKKLRLS